MSTSSSSESSDSDDSPGARPRGPAGVEESAASVAEEDEAETPAGVEESAASLEKGAGEEALPAEAADAGRGEADEGAEPQASDAEALVPAGESATLRSPHAPLDVARAGEDDAVKGMPVDLGEVGTYVLERRLGKGGMGEVYLARQVGAAGWRQWVALKLVRTGGKRSKSERFVDEARLLSLLCHESIARCYAFGELEGSHILVMEYVQGKTLRELIDLAEVKGRELSPQLVSAVLAEVAEALDYLHQARDGAGKPLNIVHRDVTPSNIILSKTGHARLVDFGVAFSTLDGRKETTAGSTTVHGKVPYLSPEQATSAPVDGRSDLFSLGSVLVEALTGEPPFGSTYDSGTLMRIAEASTAGVRAATRDMPRPLRALARRLLQRSPTRRPATGAEVQLALRRFLPTSYLAVNVAEEIQTLESLDDALAQEDYVPKEDEAPAGGSRRARGKLLVGAVALLVASLVAGSLLWRAQPRERPTESPPRAAEAPPQTPMPDLKPMDPAQQGEETVNATPTMPSSPPEEAPRAKKSNEGRLAAAGDRCMKAILSGVLSAAVAACHGGIKAGTCPAPTSKAVPGTYKRIQPLGMVELPDGAQWITPRDCYGGGKCPPIEGPVMLEIQRRQHEWTAWKLSGTAHIVWGRETVTWYGKKVEAVGRWMVLLTELRESGVQAELKDRKWPVCATFIGADGKEGIPLLTPALQADWGRESFVQFLY